MEHVIKNGNKLNLRFRCKFIAPQISSIIIRMNHFWKNNNKQKQPVYSFRHTISLENRKLKQRKLEQKYPSDKFVYVVIEDLHRLNPQLKPYMIFGIQQQMTMLHLKQYLRQAIKIDKSKSLFLQMKTKITDTTSTLGQIYRRDREEDGFLYMKLYTQKTF